MQEHEDYRLFKMSPLAGGLEEQPAEWVFCARAVAQAKEWAEALKRSREELKEATKGEEKDQDQNRIDTVQERLDSLEASHEKRIEEMRARVRRS